MIQGSIESEPEPASSVCLGNKRRSSSDNTVAKPDSNVEQLDASMAPSVSPGDLPPPAQKPKRKTLVQPALPKLPTNKRKPEANGVKARETHNGIGDRALSQTSTDGSETTNLPLTNGAHVEETGGDKDQTKKDGEKAADNDTATATTAPGTFHQPGQKSLLTSVIRPGTCLSLSKRCLHLCPCTIDSSSS